MRFQSVEGISLLGSMSELAQPLFSLTPNRRATQALTHTPHRYSAPTATDGRATSPCPCRQAPPLSPFPLQRRDTNSQSQQVDAGQTSDASDGTHLRLS
jgi:hypothetical protein